MDTLENTLNIVMLIATASLFLYGLVKGYDIIELIIYNIYFISLIIFLLKKNYKELFE